MIAIREKLELSSWRCRAHTLEHPNLHCWIVWYLFLNKQGDKRAPCSIKSVYNVCLMVGGGAAAADFTAGRAAEVCSYQARMLANGHHSSHTLPPFAGCLPPRLQWWWLAMQQLQMAVTRLHWSCRQIQATTLQFPPPTRPEPELFVARSVPYIITTS